MIRHLLFLVLSLPLLASAQSIPAADSTLSFPVTVQDARFVAGVMPPGSPVIISIAKALKGKTDSTATVNVIVRQRELAQVAQVMRTLPEGLAADVNARLLAAVMPLCAGRPWLAQQFMAVQADNRNQFNSRARAGAEIIIQFLEAWNRK